MGSVDLEGKASLRVFDNRGIAQPVHGDLGFASIGSGFYLGGNLLLQQFYSPNLDSDEASELAAYVINQVSKVDAAVGAFEGDAFYFRTSTNRRPLLGDISALGYRNLKTECKWKQKLLKYVWEQCYAFKGKELSNIIKGTCMHHGIV